MGNNRSAEIKNRYELGRYRIKSAGYDSNLGKCEIIHIDGMSDLCIQRELDPTEYNEDIEIGTINNQFTKECKQICEFYFVSYGRETQGSFKIVYEYGNIIKEKITKEKTIWKIIRQLINAGSFLEDAKMHYPILSRKYILKKDEKTFKLLNPFCFLEFIREFVQIYSAKKEAISSKSKYSSECIKRNTFQFPFVIISFISNIPEVELKQDFKIFNNEMNNIKKKFSPALNEFLFFLLQDKPETFEKIREKLNSMNINFKAPSKFQRFPPRQVPLNPSVLEPPGFNGQSHLSRSGSFRNSMIQNRMANTQKPKKPSQIVNESFNESFNAQGII